MPTGCFSLGGRIIFPSVRHQQVTRILSIFHLMLIHAALPFLSVNMVVRGLVDHLPSIII